MVFQLVSCFVESFLLSGGAVKYKVVLALIAKDDFMGIMVFMVCEGNKSSRYA